MSEAIKYKSLHEYLDAVFLNKQPSKQEIIAAKKIYRKHYQEEYQESYKENDNK